MGVVGGLLGWGVVCRITGASIRALGLRTKLTRAFVRLESIE